MIQRYCKTQEHIYAVKYDGSEKSKKDLEELVKFGNELLNSEKLSLKFHNDKENGVTLGFKFGEEWPGHSSNSWLRLGEYAVLDLTDKMNGFTQTSAEYFEKCHTPIKGKVK